MLQGCVLLSILLAKKCKGVPDSKSCDCQTSPTVNAGSRLEADGPVSLVRTEAVDLYHTIENENCDVDLKENGPI